MMHSAFILFAWLDVLFLMKMYIFKECILLHQRP